jgi:hypothetical protein
MTKKAKATPIRSALRPESHLLPLVVNGLGALARNHRALFVGESGRDFADSLEIDKNLKEGRDQENRWDYLVGHGPTGLLIAVEPHSAKTAEVSTLLRKKEAAKRQLRGHLREGVRIEKWLWVTDKRVRFANTENVRIKLDMSGITFVGRAIHAKDLLSD